MRTTINSKKAKLGAGVALRGLLAIFGGYALASLGTVFLARSLPLDKVDASLAATMGSFAAYTITAVWVFAAQTVGKAAAWVALACGTLAVLVWLPGSGIIAA